MEPTLPRGTVTFMFTDIERSTELAGRLGPAFTTVIRDHFDLIRECIMARSGYEVKTTGDGLFAVFETASQAASAACSIEEGIARHAWPDGGEIAVRIGLHTGTADIESDDYMGLDVHRAARVMGAGHGGQVLLTDPTRALLGGEFRVKPLGSHLLPGLESEVAIFQLLIGGLPSDFPPLRTSSATPNNLPTRFASVIGREEEITGLVELVEDNRVVTLLGPGGVGKTSLAVTVGAKVAGDFPGGVTFVDLSSIDDPALVVTSVAAEVGAEPRTIDGIGKRLSSQRALVVIDNFEQVLDAAPDVSGLIEATDKAHFLVTSQVPLRIRGEQRFVLRPLASNGSTNSAATRLFVERARAVSPDFAGDPETLGRLVEHLDGLPLAIELVAARANLLTPAEMLERLEAGAMSYAASADAPDRHRSLEAALEWSHSLLDDRTRSVFHRLGLFAGSFKLTAAEEVAGGSDVEDALGAIGELVDRSLVTRAPGSGRFRLLDGIRRFANEKLQQSDDVDEATQRFISYYCNLCREAYPGLQSDRGEWWRSLLDSEIDNLRTVLSALHTRGLAADGLELLGNIWRFHQSRGHLLELTLWLERFFSLPAAGEPTTGVVKGLMAHGAVLYWREEVEQAIEVYRDAVAKARTLDDRPVLADALYGLAASLIIAKDTEGAFEPLEESRRLYADLEDPGGVADVVAADAFVILNRDGLAGLGPAFLEAERLYETAGRRVQATQSLFAQAAVAIAESRLDDAKASAKRAIEKGMELNDLFLQTWGLEYLATIQLAMGEPETAALLAGAAEASRERIGGGWRPMTIGLEDAQQSLRHELGTEEANSLLEPGRALSLEDAVAAALST